MKTVVIVLIAVVALLPTTDGAGSTCSAVGRRMRCVPLTRSTPMWTTPLRTTSQRYPKLKQAPATEPTFSQVPGQHGLHPFWLPNRLWPLDPGFAFRTVVVLPPLDATGQSRFDLRVRDHRVRLYELILREGQPRSLLEHIDGNLLVDVWGELDGLPREADCAWRAHDRARAVGVAGQRDDLRRGAGRLPLPGAGGPARRP
jgi:hypothetical protein